MGNVPKPFIQKMIKMKNLLRTKSVSESDSSSIQLYNKFNVILSANEQLQQTIED